MKCAGPSLLALLLVQTACSDPRSGTFVGNPTLTARIADVQSAPVVLAGQMEALEVHVTGCNTTSNSLGRTVFTFDGPQAQETVDLPVGAHCGLFFVVDQFMVRLDTGATLIGDDFDLAVDVDFDAFWGQRFDLRFGDEAWSTQLAELAPPGETRLGPATPELTRVFFDGLLEGSTVLNAQGYR